MHDRFDAARLERILRSDFELGQHEEIFVAFSGGLDSTTLLHALVSIDSIDPERITALHFNHALNEQAGAWELHCKEQCRLRGVRMESHPMQPGDPRGRGTEAMAREARYEWLQAQMSMGSVLMTAHHLNDQVETVLANFFRGSGVRGLAGIRKSRSLTYGSLWRPLLGVERESIVEYAIEHGLQWIEDPMNVDCRYTRNHLRHRVLPVVREKWRGVDGVIARSAENWLDASELLDEIAESDLAAMRRCREGRFNLVSISDLTSHGRRRMTNALRMWFVQCGFEIPHRRRLFNVIDSLIAEKREPTCLVSWPGAEVRRYRDWLYLSATRQRTTFTTLNWDRNATDPVLIHDRRLVAHPAQGAGIRSSVYDNSTIVIRPRRGGESCQVPGSLYHKKLKKIFQEKGIPPWQRNDIPLLYIGDSLAGVVGVCYCQPYAAGENEPGVTFELIEKEGAHK